MSDIPQSVRAEVRERSGGQCEVVINGERCNRRATQQHHKKKRSGCGKHTLENLVDVCFEHHEIIERHFFKPGNEWTKDYRISRFAKEESCQ